MVTVCTNPRSVDSTYWTARLSLFLFNILQAAVSYYGIWVFVKTCKTFPVTIAKIITDFGEVTVEKDVAEIL